ncbi:MAG: signal peptidase I [Pseudomonadota bacterium]|nr:signal peptidase I [Pseudomonadota bacterium]
MDFDFNLILVPATLIFFVIWLFDKLVWKQRATRGKGNEHTAIAWAYDFWPVLAVVLVVRSFIIEPFNIPSESMVPTLETGDFILVDKSAYGIRLPLIHTKLMGSGTPERGEVVVFRYPPQPTINYIKRVIGLPGDVIRFENNQLRINGELVLSELIEGRGQPRYEQFYQETLGDHPHIIRDLVGISAASQAQFLNAYNNGEFFGQTGSVWQVTVPEGQYFVMGDNRDQSADSRFWGFVPDANLSGRAFYVWMHKEKGLKLPTFSRNRSIQ